MNNEQALPENQKITAGTEKSIKIWSESTNEWRYVPKDPNYFKTKYHEYVRAKACPFCGSIIYTQMHRHNRSNKMPARQGRSRKRGRTDRERHLVGETRSPLGFGLKGTVKSSFQEILI
jgi:hypothetical protein